MKSYGLLASLLLSVCAYADTVKDREGSVRMDKASMENDRRWIYNDWRKGLERGSAENKPVLVVLRCVPCLACAGIDASVLTAPELVPLLDQFVCVRVINANDLDLSLFQFDNDLSFSALIFNGDRAIYGRFGSWTHQKNSQEKNLSGFKAALEGALKLHKQYPANKAQLAGKLGKPTPFKDTLEIPSLAAKYKRQLDWEGKVVQSCVHCHMIGDATRTLERKEKGTLSEMSIYPWPAPEVLGLTLDPGGSAVVQSVVPGSAAGRAGIGPGDQIVTLEGQPLLSVADVSWILHHAPQSGQLQATVRGFGQEKKVSLNLAPGWRQQTDISRRVATWPMRAMGFGGMFVEDLSDEERAKRNIDSKSLALFVKHVGEYGEHALAKKAGFKKDDIILAIGDQKLRATESQTLGSILQTHQPGTKLPATVLRGDQKLQLQLPTQ